MAKRKRANGRLARMIRAISMGSAKSRSESLPVSLPRLSIYGPGEVIYEKGCIRVVAEGYTAKAYSTRVTTL